VADYAEIVIALRFTAIGHLSTTNSLGASAGDKGGCAQRFRHRH
jgi:hypothetical protein